MDNSRGFLRKLWTKLWKNTQKTSQFAELWTKQLDFCVFPFVNRNFPQNSWVFRGEDGSTKDTGVITGVDGETDAYREITDTGGVVRDVTTIVDEADRYSFYVHRIEGDGTFGDAKAKVTIQVPGISDVVVEVRPEIIGDYWLVGVIDHGKFFIRNDGVEGYGMY